LASTDNLTGQDLGGLTLGPGVYTFSGGTPSAQLTGTLTLDFAGVSNRDIVFQIGSTLTTASNSSIVVENGNATDGVFFQVGSSATLGTGSTFTGDILALSSITLTTGSNTNGRALARNGAVTLDTNNVNTCGVSICPIITVNPASLPNGTVGTPYNQSVSASGGTAPYAFSVSSGSLPTNLILNSATGAITGTPTTAGTFEFTITATDATGCSGSREYTITITSPGCPAIILSPTTLPPGATLQPYAQTITASGGTAPYTFAVIGGALPPGLGLNSATGLIAGAPQQQGLFNVRIGATDSAGCQGSRAYVLAILPAFPAGGPTLNIIGLTILMVLLAAAGLFVMNRLSI
jgi:hypothetical protein